MALVTSASAESLALQACDDLDSIHMVRRAYACIEKLIVPQHVNDTDDVYPTCTELGALVRLVNEELQRRIETAETTLQSLRAAVGDAQRG
ncbi:hypothetical protein BKP43_04660 [Variovorax boronicumulans]|uniref:hypothetical protein n=1 Tax=Variovorax boronicumulans TaxID=436515 RepID=UPI00209C2B42|nr:hypothetical protein [Variovorax boronicumulans]PBI96158.1 hypothetical protein BKP43_04660 [Variovorax boronicumulans]